VELRQLRYFIAVAEELGFNKAARRLHISQPPLSKQIQALEEEIGARLLDRSRHGVEMTEAGQAFLESARDVLARSGRAMDSARRIGRGEMGPLVMGSVPITAYTLIPSILVALRRKFPDVEIVFREMDSDLQLRGLLDGTLSAGLVRAPIRHEAITFMNLLSEDLMAVLPPGHRLAGRRKISLDSLRSERFILPGRSSSPGFYDLALAALNRAGFSPHTMLRAESVHHQMAYVVAGYGVSVSIGSVWRAFPSARFIRLSPGVMRTHLLLAYRPDAVSPALHSLLDTLRRLPLVKLLLPDPRGMVPAHTGVAGL
jgi:DNA-binding transcriptional LysR family regulator